MSTRGYLFKGVRKGDKRFAGFWVAAAACGQKELLQLLTKYLCLAHIDINLLMMDSTAFIL